MIYKHIPSKISFFNKQPDEVRLMIIYRYLSIFITSFFFIVGDYKHSPGQKLFIVLSVSIASILLNYLYVKNRGITSNITILVLIETIGISFLLIPSGGLGSPYVWCALNTVLIAAVELGWKHCWVNLFVYLCASVLVTYEVFDKGTEYLSDLISKESNLILSFILITVVIQILAKYIRDVKYKNIKLAEANNQLTEANLKIKTTMQQMMELNKTIHLFTESRNKIDIIHQIIKSTKEITGGDNVFLYSNNENSIIFNKNCAEEDKNEIQEKLSGLYGNLNNLEEELEIDEGNNKTIVTAVKSSCKSYGLLGIVYYDQEKLNNREYADQLRFLSELTSIMMESLELEGVKERLVVTQEQNRIANEIHDSILQRLFSISCSVFSLVKGYSNNMDQKLIDELELIRKSIDRSMKDLRAAVYGMSWKKNGENSFESDVLEYIDEIKRLNNVDIKLNMNGNHELLSTYEKKALYRIICEGIGNAVRHGNADQVDVSLDIKSGISTLKITDNGRGFNLNEIKNQKDKGLGLRNINFLAGTLKGKLNIDSKSGRGTSIMLSIPLGYGEIKREEVV